MDSVSKMDTFFKLSTLISIFVGGSLAATDICTPRMKPFIPVGKSLPKFPDQFSMDDLMEIKSSGSKQTAASTLLRRISFDAGRKLLSVETGFSDIDGIKIIADTDRMQVMTLHNKSCKVGNFTSAYREVLLHGLNIHFVNGNDVFRFGEKYNVSYNGTVNYRGTKCDLWKVCIDEGKATVAIDYYFGSKTSTAANTFLGFVERRQTLVKDTNITSHVFNFVAKKPAPETLQVHGEIFCPMKKGNKSLPKIPDEFEMNIEMLSSGRKRGYNIREYLDTKEKLHRLDHHHKENNIWVPVHEVHDYNAGISYMINSRTFDCKLSPLSNRSWDSVDVDDEHHIRMKTANEFFLLDATNDFVYEGMGNVRGAPVDIFARQRQMTRRNRNETVIQKWYFLSPDWSIGGQEGPLNRTNLPMKQMLFHSNRTTTINCFNFDALEPSMHILWPLRSCYENNRHYMYFRLSGKYDDYGVNHQRDLTQGIRNALASVGKISRLRVSSILIFKSSYGGVVAVRVYVLGRPSINGTVKVLHPAHLISMKEAVMNIKNGITTGNLKVTFKVMKGNKSVPISMSAQPASYYDYSAGPDPIPPSKPPSKKDQSQSGMSNGAIAGIITVLVVVAVLLTVLAMHLVLKRRGISLINYSRHTDE